jgi:hypothetical protein
MRKLLLAILLASLPAFAATAIQAWGAGQDIRSGGTAPSATLTSCATNGATFIVVFVTNNGYDATTVTLSSTSIPSGSWHHGSNVASGGATQMAIWYAYSASISNSEVVTATGNIWGASITAQCFSGVATSNQADQGNTHVCSDGSTWTSTCTPGSVTPTQGGELVVAGTFSNAVSTVNGGFTLSLASNARSIAYLIQTNPAAANPVFTFAGGYRVDAASTLTFFAADPPVDYSVSGPSSGYVYSASTNFTVTKSSGTFNGSMTITISDGSQGGTIAPSVGSPGTSSVTVTPTNGTSSFTFTYTPVVAATITLAFTSTGINGENQPPITYTSNPITVSNTCVSYTGLANVASATCTISVSGLAFDGTRSVTMTDSGEYFGGTFTPSIGNPAVSTVTVTPPSGSSFTYTYTPATTVGARLITVTNTFAGANPANVTYTATSGDVCTFTAKASGNWNASGTWTASGCTGGGHTTPTTGDTVVVGSYTVTCSTGTCYAGTAPANNTTYDLTVASGGSLVVANGATLVLTGNYKLNSNVGANPGVLNVQTGGTVLHDNNNSVSVSYRGVGGTSGDWNNIKMGTLGDSCTPGASYGYSCPTTYKGINVAGGKNPVMWGANSLTDTVTYQIYGTAIKYCGTTTLPCLDIATGNNAHGYGNAGIYDVEQNVFDTTSVFGQSANGGQAALTKLTWIGNREVSDIKGFLGLNPGQFLNSSTTCTIAGNYFDAIMSGTGNDALAGCAITDNFFSHSFDSPGWSGGPWGKFSRNFHSTGSGLAQNQQAYLPIIQNIFYLDWPTNNSSNHIGFPESDAAHAFVTVGNICASNTTAGIEGHCAWNAVTSYVANPVNSYILDNLSVAKATGFYSGSWWSYCTNGSGWPITPTFMDHNAVNGTGEAAQGWGAYFGHPGTYYPSNAPIQTYRSNIGWAPVAGSSNYQIADVNQASSGVNTQPNTMVDGNTVIDWNLAYNGTASTRYADGVDANCTSHSANPFYGTPYQLCASSGSGPGAHETTVSPKYIDATRTPDTWAYKVMGQANSIAGVRAALWGCASISSCIGNMYAWIQRGWQPTNIALKGAAHDGKIIGFSGTYGSGYSGTCGVTITPQDARDLGGTITSQAATATCTFVGGVPKVTVTSGGAHYRIATPATVAITCGGCTPTVAASLTPIIQPSDIGPVPMVLLPSAF